MLEARFELSGLGARSALDRLWSGDALEAGGEGLLKALIAKVAADRGRGHAPRSWASRKLERPSGPEST